jgi:hypothetical protein
VCVCVCVCVCLSVCLSVCLCVQPEESRYTDSAIPAHASPKHNKKRRCDYITTSAYGSVAPFRSVLLQDIKAITKRNMTPNTPRLSESVGPKNFILSAQLDLKLQSEWRHYKKWGQCDQFRSLPLPTDELLLPQNTAVVPLSSHTKMKPKYSGLVTPCIQQFRLREAPVVGRTTLLSESVCQVACSWVDVGSFHTPLVVRLIIFTVSVRNILDIPSYLAQFSHTYTRPTSDIFSNRHLLSFPYVRNVQLTKPVSLRYAALMTSFDTFSNCIFYLLPLQAVGLCERHTWVVVVEGECESILEVSLVAESTDEWHVWPSRVSRYLPEIWVPGMFNPLQ